jgi:hypothetical protein
VRHRKRGKIGDAEKRLARDIRRWRTLNRPTLIATTVEEREAAAAEVARRPAGCDACGKVWPHRAPNGGGLCSSCQAAIECLELQVPPGTDLVAELHAQRAKFARSV